MRHEETAHRVNRTPVAPWRPGECEQLSSEDLLEVLFAIADARDLCVDLRRVAQSYLEWRTLDERVERLTLLFDRVNMGMSWGLASERLFTTLVEIEGQRDVALDRIHSESDDELHRRLNVTSPLI